jgi:thiol-disulfide isomerase/thioredoxin
MLKMANKHFTLCKICCIAVMFFIICCIYMFFSPKMENFGNPASCTYYYMNKCGHCERFSPEWDKFVQSYTGPVKFKKIEMSDATDDLEKYGIKGFPTILFLDESGNPQIYEGTRSVEALTAFITNKSK